MLGRFALDRLHDPTRRQVRRDAQQQMDMVRPECPCKLSISSIRQISLIKSRTSVPISPRSTGLRYFGMNTKW